VICSCHAQAAASDRRPRSGSTAHRRLDRGCERVELAFASAELRSICESRRKATAVLGLQAALELEQRLADLAALSTVAELDALFPAAVIEHSPAERSIRLEAGYSLVFCVGHIEVPRTSSGATDWAKVSRIKITALEPTNG